MLKPSNDLYQRLNNILAEFNNKNDGIIIKIDNDTIYRFGVDGEVNINKFNSENLTVLETVINKFRLCNKYCYFIY